MRRSELAEELQLNLDAFQHAFRQAGWEERSAIGWGENLWVQREAEFRRAQSDAPDASFAEARLNLTSNAIAYTLFTGRIHVQLHVEYGDHLRDVVHLTVEHQNTLATAYTDFGRALLTLPGVVVSIVKGARREPASPQDLARFEQPEFDRLASVNDVDFYLGTIVDGSVRIARDRHPEALERCRACDRQLRVYGYRNEALEEAATLADFFRALSVPLRFDLEGNLVDIRHGQGGDEWAFEYLEALSNLMEPGSYHLIQDDLTRFWKVEYGAEAAVYFRER